MTAREKAIELVLAFKPYANGIGEVNWFTTIEQKRSAKKCAIICVDQILLSKHIATDLDFWNDVVTEINLL